MPTNFKNVLPHSNYGIWSLQLVWCCLILTKRREMKAKVINPTLLSWRKKMGNTPPYWTMSLSLSFRKGLEEFRKTEQSKTNKQTRTKQDSLHNTAFIYKESLSSNSIYSWYPSGNTRVQVGFCLFFPFLGYVSNDKSPADISNASHFGTMWAKHKLKQMIPLWVSQARKKNTNYCLRCFHT